MENWEIVVTLLQLLAVEEEEELRAVRQKDVKRKIRSVAHVDIVNKKN